MRYCSSGSPSSTLMTSVNSADDGMLVCGLTLHPAPPPPERLDWVEVEPVDLNDVVSRADRSYASRSPARLAAPRVIEAYRPPTPLVRALAGPRLCPLPLPLPLPRPRPRPRLVRLPPRELVRAVRAPLMLVPGRPPGPWDEVGAARKLEVPGR